MPWVRSEHRHSSPRVASVEAEVVLERSTKELRARVEVWVQSEEEQGLPRLWLESVRRRWEFQFEPLEVVEQGVSHVATQQVLVAEEVSPRSIP